MFYFSRILNYIGVNYLGAAAIMSRLFFSGMSKAKCPQVAVVLARADVKPGIWRATRPRNTKCFEVLIQSRKRVE